jgi:hypothetical protein
MADEEKKNLKSEDEYDMFEPDVDEGIPDPTEEAASEKEAEPEQKHNEPDPDTDKADTEDDIYDIEETFKLRVGDDVFEAEKLLAAHKQQEAFNKKMTQDLQKFAKDKDEFKKTVAWGQSLKSLKEKLSSDSELLEKVRTAISDSGDEDAVKALDALVRTDLDTIVDPYKESRDALQSRLDDIELEKKWNEKKSSLASDHGLTSEQVQLVEDACIDAKENGEFIDLEHMYFKMLNDGRIEKKDPKATEKKDTEKRERRFPKKIKQNTTDVDDSRKKVSKEDPFSRDLTEDEVKKYGSDIYDPD